MAQSLLTKKENVRTKPKPEISKIPIADWDSHLHSLRLDKIVSNPGLFDDAKIFHGYRCGCCTKTVFWVEERKKK